MSFCDWDKQKEGEYKLMAVAGRPRLIIKERVFGEEGKEKSRAGFTAAASYEQ